MGRQTTYFTQKRFDLFWVKMVVWLGGITQKSPPKRRRVNPPARRRVNFELKWVRMVVGLVVVEKGKGSYIQAVLGGVKRLVNLVEGVCVVD